MDNDVIGVALKIKYSPTSLSSSTKPKRATASNKVSPKPKLAQEKESVHWDYSKDSALKKKKKSTKYDTKCPFAANHKKEELTGLLEEQIVGNLDSGYLLGAKCSASEKVITHKTNLTIEQIVTETMFNRKLKLFTCDNFRFANDTSCAFYVCG